MHCPHCLASRELLSDDMPCVACGKGITVVSQTTLLELEAFQRPHIKRARICIAILAVLFAVAAAINWSRLAEYQQRVEALGQVIAQARAAEGYVLGLDWVKQEFREANRALFEARFIAKLQSVLFIAFFVAGLLMTRSPWEGSLAATAAFGFYLLAVLLKYPAVLLMPGALIQSLLVTIVLYFALAAGRKIRKATSPSL